MTTRRVQWNIISSPSFTTRQFNLGGKRDSDLKLIKRAHVCGSNRARLRRIHVTRRPLNSGHLPWAPAFLFYDIFNSLWYGFSNSRDPPRPRLRIYVPVSISSAFSVFFSFLPGCHLSFSRARATPVTFDIFSTLVILYTLWHFARARA